MTAAQRRPFVVVGGGLAGAKAVQTLREEGFDGALVLVGEEPDRPYERPPLSKGYLKGEQPRDEVFVHPADWYDEHDVELRLGVAASALHRDAHEVELASGERLPYEKLLLATGSVVRRLPLPGGDLDGVLYLRRVGDSERIREVLRPGARLVVVGAGWIGLEVAACARHHGAEVTVVAPEALPLQRVLGDEVGAVYADLHRDKGVDLRMQTGLREIRGSDGWATAVVLEDGTELAADAVVVGVGVRPATELAEAAGLEVDNGVVVDASLRSSDPDIFAAGDVAFLHSPLLGRRVRVEHWANALNGGPAAARSMLGKDVTYDRVPYFYSDQYYFGMEYSGWVGPEGYDHVVFRGDPAEREFIAFWVRDGRVLAGMNANVWDVVSDIQTIVRSGQTVDPERLADPDVPLNSLTG